MRQRKPSEVNLAREAGVGFCEVQCERLWCAPLTQAILQPGYKLLVLHGGQSHEANCLSEELGCPVYKAMWRAGLCYRILFAAVISVLRFSGGHLSSFIAQLRFCCVRGNMRTGFTQNVVACSRFFGPFVFWWSSRAPLVLL